MTKSLNTFSVSGGTAILKKKKKNKELTNAVGRTLKLTWWGCSSQVKAVDR